MRRLNILTWALAILAWLALFASWGKAQPTNVNVVGASATQAVITYTAPSAAACTLEVSEESDFTPLHPDVNSSLFSGANSDGGGALERRWVLGKRGKWFVDDNGDTQSRALCAGETWHWRITCGSAVSGVLTTSTVAWGNIAEEMLPPVTVGSRETMPTPAGGARWEGCHPVTGVRMIWPLAEPGDVTETVAIPVDLIDANANWTNEDPGCLLDDASNCSTTTTADALTLRITTPGSRNSSLPLDPTTVYVRLVDASHSASGDVRARWSLNNGVTFSNWVTTSALTATPATVDIGSGTYGDFWGLTPSSRGESFTSCVDKINDAGAGAATSITINPDSADDCNSLRVGSEIVFTVPVENDAPTTYTVDSVASCPTSFDIDTAVDLDNGGNGVPCAQRGNIYSNDRLVVEVEMVDAGTFSADAIQLAFDREEAPNQTNAGFFREAGIESSAGWALFPGSGSDQTSGAWYAIKTKAGADCTDPPCINLFDGQGYFQSGVGCGGIVSPVASHFSRGGAGADAWKTIYSSCNQSADNDLVVYKVVWDKTTPQTPATPPLSRSSSVVTGTVTQTIILDSDLFFTYAESFASANGVTFSKYAMPACSLNHVQGSANGDVGVMWCTAMGQDSESAVITLDLANGGVCGSTWASSQDAGTDCSATDGTGFIVSMINTFDADFPSGYVSTHAIEGEVARNLPITQEAVYIEEQTAKLRQGQPTFQVELDTALGSITGETTGVAITVSSTIPTGISPNCDGEGGCETTITCGNGADASTLCWCGDGGTESCRFHLRVDDSVTVSGEDRVVTATNSDGSVTIASAFTADPSGAAYTVDPRTPSWWTGGCPISASLFTGDGLDTPVFSRCIQVGDRGFISDLRTDVEFTNQAEHFEVTAASDNLDGTWALTITRRPTLGAWPTSGSSGPWDVDDFVTFEAQFLMRQVSTITCYPFGDVACDTIELQAGGGHPSTVQSLIDPTKSLHQGSQSFWQGTPPVTSLTPTHTYDISPAFAGADSGLCEGNSCQKHPSMPGIDPALGGTGLSAFDHYAAMGQTGTQDNTSITLVSGTENTYKLNETIYYKRLPIRFAWVGRQRFTAKATTLSDTLDDGYFCITVATNGCGVTGSAANELYFVSKDINPAHLYCISSETSNVAILGVNDPCFSAGASYGDAAIQKYVRRDYDGTNQIDLGTAYARTLVPGVFWSRGVTPFANIQPVDDEMTWFAGIAADPLLDYNYYLAKAPPLGPDTSQDPGTFVPVTIDIVQAAGADDAIVEFGYNQDGIDGNADDFYCWPNTLPLTCNVVAPTITEATPFQYTGESLASTISFSGGRATIQIPALPNRVLFYRVIQRDAGDATVSTSATEVVVVR